jgi:hypothetical protein
MTQILLIIVIALGIFVLPRMLARNPEKGAQQPGLRLTMSGRMRLAIIASLIWPALVALYLKPWSGQLDVFLYVAVGPVALIWGIFWVFVGFKKQGR